MVLLDCFFGLQSWFNCQGSISRTCSSGQTQSSLQSPPEPPKHQGASFGAQLRVLSRLSVAIRSLKNKASKQNHQGTIYTKDKHQIADIIFFWHWINVNFSCDDRQTNTHTKIKRGVLTNSARFDVLMRVRDIMQHSWAQTKPRIWTSARMRFIGLGLKIGPSHKKLSI